jgi:DNA-binding beta-propeller fold protein YncE
MTTIRPVQRLSLGVAVLLWASSLCLSQGAAIDSTSASPPVFNEKEFVVYKQKGHGALAGQAFLGASSGKAITQAGAPVHLIPVTKYTRYWFDHSVRTTACSSLSDAPAANATPTSRQPLNCAQEAVRQLEQDKHILPYLRTTRANPTGHFWFTKIPAGRYYIVSVIEGGSQKEDGPAGIAWLTVDLDASEKATNLVVTDCKSSLC